MRSGLKNIKDQLTATTQKVSAKKRIVKGERKGSTSEFNSAEYWETRYVNGGHSGNGSYGILAEYKKNFINNFIKENDIKSLIEYGCGDCNQLESIECDKIIGFDVSEEAIKICKTKFPQHKFYPIKNRQKLPNKSADLILSLDVIYHLIEDEVYEKYMENITSLDCEYIIIYSSNFQDDGSFAKHVKPRKFMDSKFFDNQYELIKIVENKYKSLDHNKGSFSDWFIYKKIN